MHIEKASNKLKLPKEKFTPWKSNLITDLEKAITETKHIQFSKPVLKDTNALSELNKLKEQFIITPIDKAHQNISFICKKYYYECLKTELSSNTNEKIHTPAVNVITDHINTMKSSLHHTLEEDNEKIPFIYWIPKHHKDPIGNRYIVSGKHCTTKILSKKLSYVFKLILKTLGNYYRYIYKFKKTSSFWVIKNSASLHPFINRINFKNNAKSISTFDFTTLYTSIPHSVLIDQVSKSIEDAFNISKKQFIKINSKYANWSDNVKPNTEKTIYFTEAELKHWLKYLLDNLYVKFDSNIFRQIVGIPMGTDCVPELANIFLFYLCLN